MSDLIYSSIFLSPAKMTYTSSRSSEKRVSDVSTKMQHKAREIFKTGRLAKVQTGGDCGRWRECERPSSPPQAVFVLYTWKVSGGDFAGRFFFSATRRSSPAKFFRRILQGLRCAPKNLLLINSFGSSDKNPPSLHLGCKKEEKCVFGFFLKTSLSSKIYRISCSSLVWSNFSGFPFPSAITLSPPKWWFSAAPLVAQWKLWVKHQSLCVPHGLSYVLMYFQLNTSENTFSTAIYFPSVQ